MKLRPGAYNQKIEIYKQENQPSPDGGSYPVDVLYWSTNANVTPIRAAKSLQAMQEVLKPAMLFIIRYRTDKQISPDMRILWRGEWFSLLSTEIDFIYKENNKLTAIADQVPQR